MTQLFLDDLYVGQKFVSESYALSEEKIIQYAQEFDRQKILFLNAWLQLDGILLLLPCDYWSTV